MADRKHRVFWSESASFDLEEIVSHIALDSPENARRVLSKLKGKADSLESYPGRGRFVSELSRFGIRNWRELIVKPYRIIYRASAARFDVLAVFDARRDLDELLLKRLVRTKEEGFDVLKETHGAWDRREPTVETAKKSHRIFRESMGRHGKQGNQRAK